MTRGAKQPDYKREIKKIDFMLQKLADRTAALQARRQALLELLLEKEKNKSDK